MTVTAAAADYSIPAVSDDMYVVVNPSGTALVVNPGDWVSFSAQWAHATHDGIAWFKASGAGIALDRNPAYDAAGRVVVNSALIVATRGIFVVSASFSGNAALGLGMFPDTTGSAVGGVSGITGAGSTWGTAAPVNISGATAAAPSLAVAQLIRNKGNANAGTAQYEIRLWPPRADYY